MVSRYEKDIRDRGLANDALNALTLEEDPPARTPLPRLSDARQAHQEEDDRNGTTPVGLQRGGRGK